MLKGSNLLIFCFVVLLTVGCFDSVSPQRKIASTEEEKTEKIPGCGVMDGRDLREMAYANPPGIFKAQCSTCHHPVKNGTGPALVGFTQKVPSKEWFKTFVTNQDSLIEAGDTLAISIQAQRPTNFTHHFKLRDKDLEKLYEYLKQ
ncbi:MAG: c-type cytochrome [Fluviicola sp.]